jgi:hypothetical protein
VSGPYCDAHCTADPAFVIHPDTHEAPFILAAVQKREPLVIAGVRYVPAAEPEPVVTDAEARAMRKALTRLDQAEGRR